MRQPRLLFFTPGVAILLLIAGWMVVSSPAPDEPADSEYFKVYCVNGRIEVGSRSLQSMRSARGPHVCLHPAESKHYPTLIDVQEAARRLGGVGVHCGCAPR